MLAREAVEQQDDISTVSMPTVMPEQQGPAGGGAMEAPAPKMWLNCPGGCTTPTGRLRKWGSIAGLVKHIQEDHPEMAINMSFCQEVQIGVAPVRVQRHVMMFDENIMELDNGDEVSVGSGSSHGSATVVILLEGDTAMMDASMDDLSLNLGQMLVLYDQGDSEDELDR